MYYEISSYDPSPECIGHSQILVSETLDIVATNNAPIFWEQSLDLEEIVTNYIYGMDEMQYTYQDTEGLFHPGLVSIETVLDDEVDATISSW